MSGHVSAPGMKDRIIKADFTALLNRASLSCALLFAVIATVFRCSAHRFRCYGLSAKEIFKVLRNKRNIPTNKPEKPGKIFSSLFFRCYCPLTA